MSSEKDGTGRGAQADIEVVERLLGPAPKPPLSTRFGRATTGYGVCLPLPVLSLAIDTQKPHSLPPFSLGGTNRGADAHSLTIENCPCQVGWACPTPETNYARIHCSHPQLTVGRLSCLLYREVRNVSWRKRCRSVLTWDVTMEAFPDAK